MLGRADAVIVSGGRTSTPTLVERALRTVPGVVDARVFGEPDAGWEQGGGRGGPRRDDGRRRRGRVRRLLRPPEVPQRWILVESLPAKLS